MHRIKIRQLETLMVFMQTGSVTDAADMLGMTQPNASKALKQTEEAIGISLFTRTGGRLQPTPEAEIIYSHVARMMDGIDFIERLSLDLANLKTGSVRIACLATFGVSLLPMLMARFNAQHPGIPLELDVLDAEKIHLLVSREHYDFGIVHRAERLDDLDTETLGSGRLVALVPRTHRLSGQASVTLADLADQKIVTYPSSNHFGTALRRAFDEQKIRFPGTVCANHSAVVHRLLESGCADIAIVEEFSVRNSTVDTDHVIKPIEPLLPVSVGLIVPTRKPLSLAASAFLSGLREQLRLPMHYE